MSPTVTLDRELVRLAIPTLKKGVLIANVVRESTKNAQARANLADHIAETMAFVRMLEAAIEPTAKPFSGPGVE